LEFDDDVYADKLDNIGSLKIIGNLIISNILENPIQQLF